MLPASQPSPYESKNITTYESSNFVRFRDISLYFEELEAEELSIITNPASVRTELGGDGPWSMYDMQGRKVLTCDESQIDLSRVKAGKYSVERSDKRAQIIVQQVYRPVDHSINESSRRVSKNALRSDRSSSERVMGSINSDLLG